MTSKRDLCGRGSVNMSHYYKLSSWRHCGMAVRIHFYLTHIKVGKV